MAWTTLSLMGILLMGGVGALLWQRHRARWLVLTRHTVRCPLYDCQATLVVRTNPLAQPGRQHVDVATCSLHPETLVTLPEKMVCVTDSSYDRPYPQEPGRYPRYTLGVPCRKNCLAILNMAVDSCAMQPVRCTSEAKSGPDLAQQATHNPVMTQALWFYSASSHEDVDFYSREYPLDTLNVDERASRDWANRIRDLNPEMRAIRQEHEALNRPLIEAARLTGDLEPTAEPQVGKDVTEEIRARARELGFLEVGFTRYDFRYTYARKRDWVKFEHAICLAYEQDYEPTQTIPSIPAEIVHSGTYRTEGAAGLDLGDFIRSLGYHAQVHSPNDNTGPYIPMFVAAGLGQLGACGYLLTPNAGSRCRLMIITTDAQVTYDQPVDYGIHAFCQVCQVCVNRCPGRALMPTKVWWRGVQKNKLYFKRCRPVMANYLGCGVCMKVCPIQKYGMAAVMAHYVDTGQVLGKGTHNLEGYTLEGKGYFGPGALPVFDAGFFNMPHGRAEDWALEELKMKLKKTDGLQSDEGAKVFEEFKTKLSVALSLSDDILQMELEDYIA